MYNLIIKQAMRLQALAFCLLAASMFASSAHAALSNDLQSLASQGNSLNTQLSAINLTADNSCGELGSAVTAVQAFTTAIETVSAGLSSPLSLDNDSLDSLDELTLISANLSAQLPALASDLSLLATGNDLADINAAIDAMLTLSDDIGTMADRILEMADRILLMADNIGLMADRILITQQIQSTNIAMTQSTMLTTQQNMVALAATISSSVYHPSLSDLIATGTSLVVDMGATQLTETNMSSELANVEARVNSYQASLVALSAALNADSAIASHYINSDTLTMLGDLSMINAQLAASLNAYANAVNTLAPTTSITVLDDGIKSMLRLASDIGVMGTRIVEMGDRINIMADNIGVMAARIVETQVLQQSNLELTQSNLTTAQITSIQIIAAFGL